MADATRNFVTSLSEVNRHMRRSMSAVLRFHYPLGSTFMHTSSYEHMADLVARHLPAGQPLRILDIGSYDVNGSYKPLFAQPGWQYVGVDLSPGPNVDVVLSSPYQLPMATGEADLVISGQAFEHVEYFWLSWLEMARILKPGGQIFLIAPSRGQEHRYPV